MELLSGGQADQVPRLAEYKESHPEVEFLTPLDTKSAFWKAFRASVQIACELDLRRLLDALEKL